jgi:hypothetical protein
MNMTTHRESQGLEPCVEIAAVFAEAIGDYSRVLHGQTESAAALCQDITATWLQGSADFLAQIDQLSADLSATTGDAALRDRIRQYTDQAQQQMTQLMAEVQRQDMARQMLDSIAAMAEAIGSLDLCSLVTSTEAAAMPRRIVDIAEAGFVMASQRRAYAEALNRSTEIDGPATELF